MDLPESNHWHVNVGDSGEKDNFDENCDEDEGSPAEFGVSSQCSGVQN